jgi:hypothetical protein
MQPSRIIEGPRDEVRRLGARGVARMRGNDDRDALAGRFFVFMRILGVDERVVVRLQVEHRRMP